MAKATNKDYSLKLVKPAKPAKDNPDGPKEYRAFYKKILIGEIVEESDGHAVEYLLFEDSMGIESFEWKADVTKLLFLGYDKPEQALATLIKVHNYARKEAARILREQTKQFERMGMIDKPDRKIKVNIIAPRTEGIHLMLPNGDPTGVVFRRRTRAA